MFIEANGKVYLVGIHADDQMLDRNISEKMVKRAIEEGELEESRTSGRLIYLHRQGNIGVVIEEETDEIVTISWIS